MRNAAEQNKRPNERKYLVADDNGPAVDVTDRRMPCDPICSGEADEGNSQQLDKKDGATRGVVRVCAHFMRGKEQGNSDLPMETAASFLGGVYCRTDTHLFCSISAVGLAGAQKFLHEDCEGRGTTHNAFVRRGHGPGKQSF